MDVKIYPSNLKGSIEVQSLKATAHRALIASVFAEKPTEIFIKHQTQDVFTTVKCLNKLGADINAYAGKLVVNPIPLGQTLMIDDEFDVGDSVATLKFLLPTISVFLGGGTFKGECKLPKKSTVEFLSSLNGVGYTSDKLPLKINGTLKGGNITLSGSVGSQAISGVLLAMPLMKTDTTLTVKGEVASKYLVDITVKVMRDFGVNVAVSGNTYSVKAKDKYVSPEQYVLDGDYTLASYYLACGMPQDTVTLSGLEQNSLQQDAVILRLIESLKKDNNAVLSLDGVTDLIYPLTVASCFKKDKTVIKNATLKTEKSQERFEFFIGFLKKMGADVIKTDDGVIVNGTGSLKGGVFVDGYGESKVAMALSVAAAKAEEPTYVLSVESVLKSYPSFFNDLIKLGAKVQTM